MIQFLLALFGLTALGMALSHNPRARRWAPVVGLFLAEPLWLYYSISAKAYGIVALGVAYSAVYAVALYSHWRRK